MIHPISPDFEDTPVSDGRPPSNYRITKGQFVPRASIVTPVFNIGPVFQETVRAVLGQSFQQYEWIIVDDGTTDVDSRKMLDHVVSGDMRVRLVRHPKNAGLSAARNTGYRAAATDFILQLDGDDLIEPTALEKYLWCLFSNPQLGFVSSLQVGFGTNRYLYPGGFFDREKFLQENRTDPIALVRRAVHAEVGGYDETNRGGLEDWEFWLACAEKGHWGYTIAEYLEWYRWSGSPRSKWSNWDLGSNQQKFCEQLRERYPQVFSGAFPDLDLDRRVGLKQVRQQVLLDNPLEKHGRQILVLIDKAERIVVEELLTLWGELVGQGASLTFCIFSDDSLEVEWPLTLISSEVFNLARFLPAHFQLEFLLYLIASRGFDDFIIGPNPLGYLCSLLQRQIPGARWLDHSSAETLSSTSLRLELGS